MTRGILTPTMTRTRALGVARFHAAQSGIYPQVIREIRRGHKQSHWMWFIFPQLRGLARSEAAHYYGIADRAEAIAYLDHPVLRMRLYECTQGVLRQQQLMFSSVDTRKLRSSMTLFAQVADDPSLPNAVLTKFFDGRPDQDTIDLLAGRSIDLLAWRSPVGRHWEKGIQAAQRAQRSAPTGNQRRPVTEPWSRERITSFVRGFGLSTVATRQLVDAWVADQGRARREGWDEGHDEGVNDAWDQNQ